jgi:hypothetical protein
MKAQAALEAENEASLDAAAEPTAASMAKIFSLMGGAEDSRALERLGYFVGRYVYLCDALDDLRKDIKTGGYNPLALAKVKEPEAFAKESIYMTAGEACLAYALLDLESYKPVLDNIVNLGLKNGADAILTKTNGHKRDVMKLGDV